MVKLLKLNLNGHELLFEKLPEAFGYRDFNEGLAENIENAKNYYDGKIAELKVELIKQTKEIFSIAANRATVKSSTGTPSVDAKSFMRSSFGVRTSPSY